MKYKVDERNGCIAVIDTTIPCDKQGLDALDGNVVRLWIGEHRVEGVTGLAEWHISKEHRVAAQMMCDELNNKLIKGESMKLYHVTTQKKARHYGAQKQIAKPVRGFTTLQGAMAWAIKVGRKIIYEIDVFGLPTYKLPDHHNAYGQAWWVDADVKHFKCVFSADKDA